MTLTLALSYGSREELLNVVKIISDKVKNNCDIRHENTIKEFKIVSIKNVTGEAEYYTSKKIPTFSVNVKIVSTDKRIHSYYSDLIEDIEVIIRRKYMVQLLIDDVDINKIPETTNK